MEIDKVEFLLKECLENLRFKQSSLIVSPNRSEQSFFFIKNGFLKQYYKIDDKKHVFRLIEQGDFCGSITNLYGDPNKYEFIETVSDVTLVKFDYVEAIKIINCNLELAIFFREIIEQLLYYQEKRIIKFLSLSPGERYQNFLKEDFSKFGKFSDTVLASYLGITKESFSRFRNRKH